MKNSIYTIVVLLVIVLAGCKDKEVPKVSTDKESEELITNDFSVAIKWELDGFKMPESVYASPNHKWLYVSNTNGAAPGFISRVSKDGVIDNLNWTTGLTAPTGSDIYKNTLYVADQKQVHLINLDNGSIIKSYADNEAGSLNDLTINQKTGQVFISDVPGGKIYTIENDKLVVWLQSDKIPFPNSVFVENNTLVVANYGLENGEGLMRKEWEPEDFGSLYNIDITSKKVTLITSSNKKGVFDGVTSFNGVLLASSNPTGQLFTFDGDKSYLIDASSKGIADINTDGEIIYAPYIFDNKLIAYQPVSWDRITTKEDYIEKGADNYYGDEGGASIATSDGIIKGNFGGQELKGTWNWEGEYFCRTSTLGTMDLGSDCIQIDVTDTKMRLILNKGTGMSVVYDKKKDPEITILSTFKIKSDKIDLFKKEMLENQEVVRKEAGTLEMKLFQDKNNPENFLVFGINEGEKTLESHTEAVDKRGIADRVKSALIEAPKTLFLNNEKPLPTNDFSQIKVDNNEVLLFFIFEIKEGYKEEFVKQLIEHTELTRQEEGNIRFDFYSIKGKENSFALQQRWKNDEAGVTHRKQSYTQVTDKLMKEAIIASSQQEFFVNQIEK
ncbi:antibiotic biosynthesis monooxygenase [Polaribacter sp. Z014]|uniref:antibiotic biosynthesis monooxygenase n=1 Tax=Polaribacter sp. Z014 TaxID=2927126 RepID=UPI0020228BD0|nr:antibiotic biosynthesis monooxygenase [Polaribacter sp. Z014]MCL7764566.1 antibiotic biosynthesis monooxygenase [Polaribacter sp. Z014]